MFSTDCFWRNGFFELAFLILRRLFYLGAAWAWDGEWTYGVS